MTDQVKITQPRRQTIEQERGREAWKCIQEIKDKSKKSENFENEYRTLARGLNAMVQVNGLGQTLGFLSAKSKNSQEEKTVHFYLLAHLTHWMHVHFDKAIVDSTDNQNAGFLHWVTDTATNIDYRRATTECLAFGNWLRRFAEAELKDPNASSKDGGQ